MYDPGCITPSSWQGICLIPLGEVDGRVLVLEGTNNVVEGIPNFLWREHVQQPDANDVYAGVVAVQCILEQSLNVGLYVLPLGS